MNALRCRLGLHAWITAETRPVQWLHDGRVRDAEIRYRRCSGCGMWQREDFWSGRYDDIDRPHDVEPNPAVAPDLD